MRPLETRRMSKWLCLLASLLVLQSVRGFEAGISFTGSLERVGDQSISIKLADRRVIDAMLPNTPALGASAIAAQYRMGDEVEIGCQSIRPVWEAATSRFQSLEVTAIRFLRRPSPDEVSNLLEAKPREGKNLLQRPRVAVAAPNRTADSDAPGSRELEHARRINLEYAANMPNFVADESAKRYRSAAQSPAWRPYDTVEAEIAFRGRRAVRQQIRRNGKPWDQPFDALPGFKWYEGFETEISPLFDPQCPTTIEYEGRSTMGGRVDGRQLLDYRFSSPVDGCFPFLYFAYQRYNPARIGHVFIDDPGGSAIQVDDEASGFPADFEFAGREEHMFWDYVKIGENSHLLPVRADFLVVYSSGVRYRVEVEYKNHRHFEASTNITFH
jgi:hypothetical protein